MIFPKSNDLVREQWSFHGWSGGTEGIQEHVGPPVFRFVIHHWDNLYTRLRVNCMGWPVSGYQARVVSEEEMNAEIANATFDDYYKVYRARPEQVDL